MLSVLPAGCVETSPWSHLPPSRKRSLPIHAKCVGESSLGAARAKRLRQELLRLREWEQQVHQEAWGAFEGAGDSTDASFDLEPPNPVVPLFQSSSGGVFFIEDASDTTTSPLHGLPSRVTSSDTFTLSPTPCTLYPYRGLQFRGVQCKAASNPSNPQQSVLSLPVHTLSLPSRFVFPPNSPPVLSPCSAPFPGHVAVVQVPSASPADGLSQGGCSAESCEESGSGNPLQDFWAGSANDGASVQMCKPHAEVGLDGASAGKGYSHGMAVNRGVTEVEGEEDGEEDLPREETSLHHGGAGTGAVSRKDLPLVKESMAMEIVCGEAGIQLPSGTEALSAFPEVCMASASVSLLLPPLPAKFLDIPVSQRLRMLEFLVQASEALNLSIQALYLAASMLDCCTVEERVRRCGTAQAGCSESSGGDLQLMALACLYQAYSCTGTESGSARSLVLFERLLLSATNSRPRVAAMLPMNRSRVEECLQSFLGLLPMAVAKGTLSTSPWVYGSILELRGVCLQKEHLVVFVSELCALGVTGLPRSIVAAANCCLVTGGVQANNIMKLVACCGSAGHLSDHFQVLQSFLCSSMASPVTVGPRGGGQGHCGIQEGACDTAGKEAACMPEPSVEVSV